MWGQLCNPQNFSFKCFVNWCNSDHRKYYKIKGAELILYSFSKYLSRADRYFVRCQGYTENKLSNGVEECQNYQVGRERRDEEIEEYEWQIIYLNILRKIQSAEQGNINFTKTRTMHYKGRKFCKCEIRWSRKTAFPKSEHSYGITKN